jgi:signal transduction histidine kinase
MKEPQRALRSRLAGSFVALLLAGLLVFAAIAVLTIDRTLRSSLDARLQTQADAAASFIDVHHGRLAIDADDRVQLLTVLGVDTDAVVLDPRGAVLISSAARTPREVLALRGELARFVTVGTADRMVRAFVLPIVHDDEHLGTVIVWRGISWIGQTDREAAIAFAAAALLIAGLALLAGNALARRAVEDAFARQRRFTADASHELRAPLAVIRAEADLALRSPREPNEYRTALEAIAGEADRIEALIGDLLSAARAESGQIPRERVDLTAIVRSVAERLAPAAAMKDAAISVSAPDGSAIILADPIGIERAMIAIAHNAIRYAPERGFVQLKITRRGSTIEAVVSDNGPGFLPSALDHALERFWRADTPYSSAGTGLGLAIARSIVESAGGTITLENSSDGGAVVRLKFTAA